MADETNEIKWIGVRATSPESAIPIKPAASASKFAVSLDASTINIPIDIKAQTVDVAVKPISGATNFPIDIKAQTVDVAVKPSTTQYVFQTEPGPWAATRAGVTRTQVVKNATQVGSGTTTIHTVTTGKTLYLTSTMLGGAAGANVNCSLLVTDASDSTLFTLLFSRTATTENFNSSNSYIMPVVISAGYKIKIVNDGAVMVGTITGWEE